MLWHSQETKLDNVSFFFCVCVCLVTLETIICISEAVGSYEGGKTTGVSSKTPPNPYFIRQLVNYLVLGNRWTSLDILYSLLNLWGMLWFKGKPYGCVTELQLHIYTSQSHKYKLKILHTCRSFQEILTYLTTFHPRLLCETACECENLSSHSCCWLVWEGLNYLQRYCLPRLTELGLK